jgi:dihydrofolate reductase
MAELIADLFISLDGFAAGENSGPFFGYGGPELEERVRDVLSRPQLVVMGRVTYLAMSAISMPATDEISSRMGDLPKAVVSNTLAEPLAWRNTRIVRGDLAAGIGALKRESDVPLRTIGSLALVSSMLKLGLVDVLRLTIFPLTLGPDGREPFSAGYPRAGLDLADVRMLDSRLVMLEYRILETGRHADHEAGQHGPGDRRHRPGLHGHDALLRHGDTAG